MLTLQTPKSTHLLWGVNESFKIMINKSVMYTYLEKAYFLAVQQQPVQVAEPNPEMFNNLVQAKTMLRKASNVCLQTIIYQL